MLNKNLGLLLAAAAAYGFYRYKKMTPEQKDSLKQKGKDLFQKNFGGLGDLFGKKAPAATENSFSQS
jgi:hypothetical protein